MPRMGPETPNKTPDYEFRHKAFDIESSGAISSPPPAVGKVGYANKSYQYWQFAMQAESEYSAGDYNGCLTHIIQAKKLVDNNNNKTANAQYKSIVYYDYSWFLLHIKPEDKAEALSYIDKAIEMYKPFQRSYSVLTENCHYMQDCLVHKAYVLFLLDRVEEAESIYYDAFELDDARFVAAFTTDGTGRELLFWAVDLGKVEWLDRLLVLKQEKESAGQVSKINPNVSSDMGLSVLTVAVLKSHLIMIDRLLTMGADPLYCAGERGSESAFSYALSHSKWELCQKFIDHIKEDERIDVIRSQVDFEQLADEDAPVELQDRLRKKAQIGGLQDADQVSEIVTGLSSLDAALEGNIVDIIGQDKGES